MFKWKTCLIVLGILGVLLIGFVGFAIWSIRGVMSRFEHFDPKTYQGETGKIVLADSRKDFSVFLTNTKTQKFYTLNTQDGTIIAPTADYNLINVTINESGDGGTKWMASYKPSHSYPIKVVSGQTQTLDIDMPLTASVNVEQNGSEATFDLVVTNSSNWECSLRPYSDEQPKFQVLSSSGQVLWQDSFEYG